MPNLNLIIHWKIKTHLERFDFQLQKIIKITVITFESQQISFLPTFL